ncbi:MAG: GlsB/YeaQ/YmgE family stress response membrane protein [Oceanospirillaceae bacterium]|nr:GlsB/YeaQ/YmgE family stress response membrane protein [Oceanospirillaceae bacterium]
MDSLSFIILGLAAGIIAKWLMPGNHGGGLILTLLLGVAGAFLGRFIANHFGFEQAPGLNWQSLVAATGGAFLLLYLADIFSGQHRE